MIRSFDNDAALYGKARGIGSAGYAIAMLATGQLIKRAGYIMIPVLTIALAIPVILITIAAKEKPIEKSSDPAEKVDFRQPGPHPGSDALIPAQPAAYGNSSVERLCTEPCLDHCRFAFVQYRLRIFAADDPPDRQRFGPPSFGHHGQLFERCGLWKFFGGCITSLQRLCHGSFRAPVSRLFGCLYHDRSTGHYSGRRTARTS